MLPQTIPTQLAQTSHRWLVTGAAGFSFMEGDTRPGDMRHSLVDISAARDRLGYAPTHSGRQELEETLAWYAGNTRPQPNRATTLRILSR